MKNRTLEICTSGSVRDEAGQPPHLLGRRKFLHLAAGAAALPAVSRFAGASLSDAADYNNRAFRCGRYRWTWLRRVIVERVRSSLAQTVIIENIGRSGG